MEAIAASAAGTELFIGYYSPQNDTASNSLTMAYGARANITNGLAKATFDCIPISPTNFPILFAGTNSAGSMQFDPVWPQQGLCLDSNAVAVGLGNTDSACGGNKHSSNEVVNFAADDYTWAGADDSYYYFAWCDRSRRWSSSFLGTNYTRPDADVMFGKIRQTFSASNP